MGTQKQKQKTLQKQEENNNNNNNNNSINNNNNNNASSLPPKIKGDKIQWVCEYCEVAVFDLYQDALHHEESCKFNPINKLKNNNKNKNNNNNKNTVEEEINNN